MKRHLALVPFVLTGGLLSAQIAPPATPTPASVSGSITQLNYGPEMEADSFILNNNTIVNLPPHVACKLGAALSKGAAVQLQGYSSTTASGMQALEATSVSVGGKTYTLPQPGQFTAYSGSAKIAQFNYDRQGNVDGFLLDNGVFAKIPPNSLASVGTTPALGATVAITGDAHQTIGGQTVVHAQTINGQTIAPPAPAGPPTPPAGPGAPPPPPAM